ncbi:MAG TPA: BamA/TamA family outer membrane protein, partial [Bacteroidota bacterium]|nr:BamA/TamA family outer membrane protein [Bacteroidota bacterium]
SHVDEPQLYVNSRGGGLLINVNEGNTNAFDGIIGYAPAQSNGSGGIVTGFVNVSMRNLFGTARKLNVHWQSDERDAQELGVEYVEPWIFSLPIDLSAGFTQRQQDSSYVQRFVNGRIDLLLNESLTLSGVVTLESVIPSSTLAVPVVQESRTSTAGVELRYDTRNDIISPTAGVNYTTNYQAGTKTIDGASPNSLAVSTLSVDASVFLSTAVHQVLAVGFHGRERTGGSIELGDLYRLGGANSLRGYLENQFLGSRIAWTNTEYRFLLARRSYFFLLFDVGYFYLPGDDTKGIASTQQMKYGYGVGIRMDTSLGNIGISLAFGQGDSFTEGKLHFGLANEF